MTRPSKELTLWVELNRPTLTSEKLPCQRNTILVIIYISGDGQNLDAFGKNSRTSSISGEILHRLVVSLPTKLSNFYVKETPTWAGNVLLSKLNWHMSKYRRQDEKTKLHFVLEERGEGIFLGNAKIYLCANSDAASSPDTRCGVKMEFRLVLNLYLILY